MPYWLKRRFKKIFFFRRRFFIFVFVGSEQFLPNFKHILIGLYVPMPVVKNQRGSRKTFLSYSAVKVSSSHFPEIAAQKVLPLQYGPPLSRSLAGRWANFGGL
jgi:hypothetical protein